VTLGSFSASAKRLYAMQSAVSMRVRELERTLGVDLFDRTHRSARLTPRGRELMEYASYIGAFILTRRSCNAVAAQRVAPPRAPEILDPENLSIGSPAPF
jgi:hypothetical protein